MDLSAGDQDPEGPFNAVTYTIIGDDRAPTFFEIGSDDGKVVVRKDLKTENVEFYTVRHQYLINDNFVFVSVLFRPCHMLFTYYL